MNERMTNEELAALLAADGSDPLEPDEVAELALLADVLADPSMWTEPDARLADAVVQAIAAEPDVGASPSVGAAVARRPGAPWRRFAFAAAAIAAAIAIVVGAVVATEGGSSPDFNVQLSASALAPGARGSAAITRNNAGFRVALDAHGLPTLPAGEYYEAWLKNAAGTLVPIGTFSSSDGRITLWSGVSPKDFPTLTVTIEATDNNQASSGRKVLVGPVHAG
jgi:hypothetical protein